MSNPHNLLNVLTAGVDDIEQAPPVVSGVGNAQTRPSSLSYLTDIITETTNRILDRQLPILVQTLINSKPSPNVVSDQTIDEQYRGDFQDFEKIPDIVKSLREFNGSQGEFNSWRKSVERILQIYESCKGTPKYFGILNTVRNKIVGSADIVLESYNTPLDWAAIRTCLSLHYADKRDLSTLEYQLTSLVQGRMSIHNFYQAVYKHLSLILNKVGCLNASNESLQLLTKVYRDKALDTFIRGLNGDLPKLLGMREPTDLPEALHLCQKLENQNFRTTYAQASLNTRYTNQYSARPPLPPRNNSHNHNVAPLLNHNNFYPQLAYAPAINQSPFQYAPTQPKYTQNFANTHNPTRSNYPNYHQNFPNSHNQARNTNPLYPQNTANNYHFPNPPRPIAPKPQPRPEPMSVDGSLHTRHVNYMNRPQSHQVANKRPPPPTTGTHFQPKVQRSYHIECETDDYDRVVEENFDEVSDFQAYSENYNFGEDNAQVHDNEEVNEYSDIHFLE